MRGWQTYLEEAESSGATGEAAREAFMEAGLRHPFAPDRKVLESARVILNFSG